VLYLTRQVEDGNFESAYLAFKQAGDEARLLAEESASGGHKESARQAYLWAQNFYDSATYFIGGSKNPTRFLATWELLYDCWLKAVPLFEPVVEPVRIPYESTELHGFFFRGNETSKKRPLLILCNGSDGSLLDMWLWGGAVALARGYDCLTFDGPGQGHALWKQKLEPRPVALRKLGRLQDAQANPSHMPGIPTGRRSSSALSPEKLAISMAIRSNCS
jgi:hypothetical protein